MKSITNKKAISPLIATVLLVVIALAMFIVVYSWLRGMISEQTEKFGAPIETQCEKVIFTARAETNNVIITNQGNIPIVGISVKIKFEGKTLTKSVKKPVDGVVSAGETETIAVGDDEFLFSKAEKKTITPIIQGKSTKTGAFKRFICQTKAVDIK